MKINNADGAVYWITGLSGAGKSSIGFSLYSKIRESKDNVIFLDGDMVRSMMGNDLGYDVVDRIKNAYRISNLCKFLSDQGHDIICSTMSLYPEVLDWNRGNIQRYFQIFIDVSQEVLHKRNQKGLYSGFLDGTVENLVGADLDFYVPKNNDLVIVNNNDVDNFDKFVNSILALIDE